MEFIVHKFFDEKKKKTKRALFFYTTFALSGQFIQIYYTIT